MVRKFIYSPKLYLGESISKKKLDKIKKRLEAKPLCANVYLLTFARNTEDQLEFFDARQLALPHYNDYTFHVVGIASDWDEAAALVEQIVQECLSVRGDCSLKEYLSCWL